MTSLVLSALLFFLYNTLSQASISNNERIIGGQPSSESQFPYVVGYHYVKDETTSFCSGTILNSRWILTAAHCIVNATRFTVYLGTNNLAQAQYDGLVINSTKYIAHPSYNPSNFANDIGLISLETSITFTEKIQPIQLSSETLLPSKSVVAVGWGATSDGASSPSNTLYHVSLTTISNSDCLTAIPGSGSIIRDSVVCVRGDSNQGTCRGDAGGPLVQIEANGNNVQVGVSIFHAGNCEDTYPSGFIRTGDYIDWIKENSFNDNSSASTAVLFLPLLLFSLFLY